MEEKSKKNSKVEIVEFNDTSEIKEEKVVLSEEEKEEIKKKMKKLLIFLVIFGALFLTIILWTNVFKSTDKIENKRTEEKEETITTSDNTTQKYKNLLTFSQYDSLFNANLKNIFLIGDFSKLDNSNKLYFASKSAVFTKYLRDNNILDQQYSCDSNNIFEFDPSVIKEAMEDVFGPNVTYKNDSFNYGYYKNDILTNAYNITFSNGKYKISCNDSFQDDINFLIKNKIEKVINDTDKIVIDTKIVFITKDGIYSDPNTTSLITDDPAVTYDTYMSKATTYKFIFNKVNGNYYLSGIEK